MRTGRPKIKIDLELIKNRILIHLKKNPSNVQQYTTEYYILEFGRQIYRDLLQSQKDNPSFYTCKAKNDIDKIMNDAFNGKLFLIRKAVAE